MIIKHRMGQMVVIDPTFVRCPFGLHYHSGDQIEIGLEMIICEELANQVLKEILRCP